MINPTSQVKLMLGLGATLLVYLGVFSILSANGILERSGGVIAIPALFLAMTFQTLLLIYGIWRKKSWTSGKFLRVVFALFLKTILIMIFLAGGIPWLFPLGAGMLGGLFFSLYHIAKIPADYWNPKPFNISLLFNLFSLACIVELVLISFQFAPGAIFSRQYFKRVDKLVVKTDYGSDASGIMRITPEGQELAATGMWEGRDKEVCGDDSTYSCSVHSVFTHYKELRERVYQNAYTKMLDSLAALPDSSQTALDSAYLQTLTRPINRDGFRSIPFQRFQTDKPKLLLIGDSFTFGWSADGWTDSFADLLATKGYVVYNAGITGTDPAQYEAVARKYIQALEPDFVIVNVYLGNDVVYSNRNVSFENPVYHVTNAGVLMNAPTGECLGTAQEAYQFYLDANYINTREDATSLEKLASQSVLGTALWRGLGYLGIFKRTGFDPNQEYWERGDLLASEFPTTESYLESIQAMCRASDAKFNTVVIPTNSLPSPDLDNDFPGLFRSLKPLIPELSEADFVPGVDGHYNNDGHAKHAETLDVWMRGIESLE